MLCASIVFFTYVCSSFSLKARWCTISTYEQQKCNGMKQALLAEDLYPEVECVFGRSVENCLKLINTKEADLITVDANYLERAEKEYGLVPIMSETYNDYNSTVSDYAVALVYENSGITMETLKGVSTCHEGVADVFSWKLPIGVLFKLKQIKIYDCTNPLVSVNRFVGGSCVLGASSTLFNPVGLNISNLCTGCITGHSCLMVHPKVGASINCLHNAANKKNRIAFTSASEMLTMQRSVRYGALWPYLRLICPNSTPRPLNEYKTCNFGRLPARVVVARSESINEKFKALFTIGGQRFADDDFYGFRMFDSRQIDLSVSNLIFLDSTKRLLNLTSVTGSQWLGNYVGADSDLLMCPIKTIKWCVISNLEEKKCESWKKVIKERMPKWEFSLECIRVNASPNCVELLYLGKADLVTLDPSLAVTALLKNRAKSVALVQSSGKKEDDHVIVIINKKRQAKLNSLQRHNFCLPGIETAPYLQFIAYLKKSGQLNKLLCNSPSSLSKFVDQACLPGSKRFALKNGRPEENDENICSLCQNSNCLDNHDEIHYSSEGAFRCMDDVSDSEIAVTTAHVVYENTDMRTYKSWNWNLRSPLLEVLCQNGSKALFSQYASCNIGRIPNHLIVTRPTATNQEISIYFHFLLSLKSLLEEDGWEKVQSKKSIFRSEPHSNAMLPDTGRSFRSMSTREAFQYFDTFQGFYDVVSENSHPSASRCVFNSAYFVSTCLYFYVIVGFIRLIFK